MDWPTTIALLALLLALIYGAWRLGLLDVRDTVVAAVAAAAVAWLVSRFQRTEADDDPAAKNGEKLQPPTTYTDVDEIIDEHERRRQDEPPDDVFDRLREKLGDR